MSSGRRHRRSGTAAPRGAARFFDDVRAAVGAPRRGAAPSCCVLCGSARVEYGGLWRPTPAVQARLLVPSGRWRLVGYGLCGRCFRLPDAARRAEDAILADFAELAASPLRN